MNSVHRPEQFILMMTDDSIIQYLMFGHSFVGKTAS